MKNQASFGNLFSLTSTSIFFTAADKNSEEFSIVRCECDEMKMNIFARK